MFRTLDARLEYVGAGMTGTSIGKIIT